MMKDDSHNYETNVTKRLKKLIEASQFLAEIESIEALFPKLLELA